MLLNKITLLVTNIDEPTQKVPNQQKRRITDLADKVY